MSPNRQRSRSASISNHAEHKVLASRVKAAGLLPAGSCATNLPTSKLRSMLAAHRP